MNQAEKIKAIEYLVHDVFLAEHNKQLAIFLASYTDSVRKSVVLSIEVGMPIQYPPVNFDLRVPTEKLVNNLAAFEVLHKKDDKPQ